MTRSGYFFQGSAECSHKCHWYQENSLPCMMWEAVDEL